MTIDEIESATEPFTPFQSWMSDAERSEPNDPNAAALATVDQYGSPSVRMVLVKRVDKLGFCFFTNSESRKGMDLAANPRAALCFYWKSLQKQVRVEGHVVELPALDVDIYFHSRSRGSQLGAAVSRQSRPLKSREELEELIAEVATNTPGEVPRPPWWKGYAIRPERIEFWAAGESRLHDRIVFLREEDGWRRQRLFP